MVKNKNLSSCACIVVFLSNVILAIQQGIQKPSNAAIQPSTSTGFIQHPGYPSSPYHPHHMPLQYGMQPSHYMMPMMDPDYLDHRMDMAKDMAKQRYAMNMYRQSYSPMGMYPRYPYQQPNQFGPGLHSAPMNIAGVRQGSSPMATQSAQKSKPTSGSKKLSRKKRFVPMMPIPFAPFGGFSPMLGVLRGAAVAGNMAMVHRGRLANMRALAARRNRNGFNQNSRSRESSVSSFNSQSNRPMDNSFNAINNVVARSTGAQPTVVQQLVPQPLSQPVMTQNIISQPGQLVTSDPLFSQPALTQNLLEQPSFIDPMGLGSQQQIIVDNGLGGQQQAIVDGGLATQPQILIDSGVVGQQPVVIDNTLAGQQQQIADQQAVNQQLAAQATSNKQLDAALQLQMDVQQAINQQTSQQSRLTDQQLTPQNTQLLYSDAGQQTINQQTSPQLVLDVLGGQQPQSSQQIYNLQQNQQALDQQAVNQQILNQQALDQQTLNQQALIQQALNQPTLNQQVLDQQALNQQVLNQQAFNQPILDQQTLNQQTLIQQALDQQALNQPALNQQTLDQQAMNQQILNQQALNQQTFNQQTLNQPALNQQTLDQQVMNQQILNQQALNQQALDQQVLNQQILNEQLNLQQPSNQQILVQQPTQQQGALQQSTGQQMSLAYPDLFSFKDPLASNQGNSLQVGQAQTVEPATPGVVTASSEGASYPYGGGGPPPPSNPSQTGQQANLAALDLIANLASLNQRGMIPKHQGRPFNL